LLRPLAFGYVAHDHHGPQGLTGSTHHALTAHGQEALGTFRWPYQELLIHNTISPQDPTEWGIPVGQGHLAVCRIEPVVLGPPLERQVLGWQSVEVPGRAV
jgi:hypothetical protein